MAGAEVTRLCFGRSALIASNHLRTSPTWLAQISHPTRVQSTDVNIASEGCKHAAMDQNKKENVIKRQQYLNCTEHRTRTLIREWRQGDASCANLLPTLRMQ